MDRDKNTRRRYAIAIGITAAVAAAAVGAALTSAFERDPEVPSFRSQACGLEPEWLELTKRGYYRPRSGQIALLPTTPGYMASGAGGWSHSGPWDYLQEIPLVFYGPGYVPATGEVESQATLADVAPTLARLMGAEFDAPDGVPLAEVVAETPTGPRRKPPRLVVSIVWDGGGWNALNQWPDAWPNLARLMSEGVSYTGALAGSNPSVTPAVHTTLGTGAFPNHHGITGVPVRDENGEVVDAFLKGESGRFIRVPSLAEVWDEAHGNDAKIGMVGYEPWHLGMIGRGAEKPGGDGDDAVWLDIETNEWITNQDHYRMPPAIPSTPGLEEDIERLDARDGELDGAWGDLDILGDVDRIEETPAFIDYHGRVLRRLIEVEGYGADGLTDMLFTNFKQIDRVGHYFNMASEQVHESIVESDRQLGALVDFLDAEVGRSRYVMVVTADHGQQPDEDANNGYGIAPKVVAADIDAEFGPVTRAVWPTEVFLLDDAMEERDVTVAEVAEWLGDYRLNDNTTDPRVLVSGKGVFEPDDRLFAMAIPSRMLPDLECGGG